MLKLFLGACCIGFAPIFVRLVALEPTPIGFYRCSFAALALSILLVFRRKTATGFHRWPRQVWGLILAAGLLFAMDLYVWHRSVVFAGAGIGTILGNTQVFYVTLFGAYLYRESLSRVFLGAVGLAFIGVYLLVGFHSSSPAFSGANPKYGRGILFGLATGVIYATYILVMRKLEGVSKTIGTDELIAGTSAVSAFFLGLASWGEGSLRLPSGMEWTWLILLALVAQVCGWILITRALPRVPVSRAGLVLLAQPLVAVTAGNWLLGESLSPVQLVGGSLTLFSIYLGSQKRKSIR